MNAIDQLKSVLCNTMGKCCIAGSDEDRAIVDLALQSLSEPAPVQEPVPIPEMLRETSPERIWLGLFTDDEDANFPSDHEGVCWAESEFADLNVQYIRADLAVAHPAQTKPPLLTDEEVGQLTVFAGLHDIETTVLAEFIRAIERVVRRQFRQTQPAPVQEQQPAPASKPVLLQCLGCERVGTQEQLSASTDCDCWLHTQPAPVERTVRGASKKLWLQQGVFPDLADFDANGLPRFYSQESATKFQGGQLSKPCTGKNCGSMNGWMHSIECIAEHEAVITATHSESAPVQMPVTWNQVQVCTWIGNQLMTQPSMFERNAVCKFVRSLGRNEKLAKYFPAPMAAQPRKAVKLTDDEIKDAINSTIGIGYRHLDEFARAIEAAVWAKLGVEP